MPRPNPKVLRKRIEQVQAELARLRMLEKLALMESKATRREEANRVPR